MLKNLIERRLRVDWKHDKTLNIRELSFKDYEEVLEIEKLLGSAETVEKGLNLRFKFVLKALNRNLEHVPISEKDLESVNLAFINALWFRLIERTQEIINDPN
ncbi:MULTISPECIES: hypothetical protein [unclassified Gemella]|uniref:hypothetical protein n=1 Tax=unclassified Gemella TaxID=2624949 RepID=UPI001C051121|nr:MULTISPECIES: hypothetical protein [unclassified Gemella]MBU0279212.1 hypothetical protein [Gemella sp. zg-1178]QWQ39317.1 hypothetical protein KMP11_03040 [Gemella sp. zg-570]